MVKGGYHIVDFKGVNLSTTNVDGVTISGIYDSIENSYSKPLLFTGITIEGVEKNDAYETVTSGENSYTVTLYTHTITISNDNIVKIAWWKWG